MKKPYVTNCNLIPRKKGDALFIVEAEKNLIHPLLDGYTILPNEDYEKLVSQSPVEQEIENEIVEKGLTAPRLTPELIDATILKESFHVFEGSCLTVCCLTLQNGFTVTGASACASPENFNVEVGEKIARADARDKIWMLEGYLLKERLNTGGRLTSAANEV